AAGSRCGRRTLRGSASTSAARGRATAGRSRTSPSTICYTPSSALSISAAPSCTRASAGRSVATRKGRRSGSRSGDLPRRPGIAAIARDDRRLRPGEPLVRPLLRLRGVGRLVRRSGRLLAARRPRRDGPSLSSHGPEHAGPGSFLGSDVHAVEGRSDGRLLRDERPRRDVLLRRGRAALLLRPVRGVHALRRLLLVGDGTDVPEPALARGGN